MQIALLESRKAISLKLASLCSLLLLSFQWSTAIVGLLTAASLFPPLLPVYAQNCIETITCPITDPLEFFIQPFILQMGDWFYVVAWALVGGIIYNRSGNVMLVGIIGIIIGTSLLSNNILTSSSNSIMLLVVMVGVGAGLVLFQLWRSRLNNPS